MSADNASEADIARCPHHVCFPLIATVKARDHRLRLGDSLISLGDSLISSTRIRFSVHTGLLTWVCVRVMPASTIALLGADLSLPPDDE
jgi:hypothetical protein